MTDKPFWTTRRVQVYGILCEAAGVAYGFEVRELLNTHAWGDIAKATASAALVVAALYQLVILIGQRRGWLR